MIITYCRQIALQFNLWMIIYDHKLTYRVMNVDQVMIKS